MDRPPSSSVMPTLPVSALIAWTEASTCSFYMSANWLVNYVRRQDNTIEGRITAGIHKPAINHPDEKGCNRVFIREDFALSQDRWKCNLINIEHVHGIPTAVMAAAIQRSYGSVRNVCISYEFSSVYAILKLISNLPSVECVTLCLNNSNIAQTQPDIECIANNGVSAMWRLPIIPTVHTFSIRSAYAPNEKVDIQPWIGHSSRISFFAKFMFVVFSNLHTLKMNAFGDAHHFHELVRAMDSWAMPEEVFRPHRIDLFGYTLKIDLFEKMVGQPNPRAVPVPTPPSGPHDNAGPSSRQGPGPSTSTSYIHNYRCGPTGNRTGHQF